VLATSYEISDWDVYTIGGEIAVGRVLRFEELDKDLTSVASMLNLSGDLELPRSKASNRAEGQYYSDVLDERCRAVVEPRWAREIEAFGYAWEGREARG
jgi:hypothetical protein